MTDSSSHYLLNAEGICKTYKTRTVVDQVSLNVGHGEIVGLLGPNGAGQDHLLLHGGGTSAAG